MMFEGKEVQGKLKVQRLIEKVRVYDCYFEVSIVA